MLELYYLHGQPMASADLKNQNRDFLVQEILPFLPSGDGEHHLLHMRKDGLNTVQLAEKIAKFAKVHPKEVSFAGQKDKHAVTEQWFGVRIPGKSTPDWQQLNDDKVTVIASHRHSKKLRSGALVGNRFSITLRNVSDTDVIEQRLQQIIAHGVPNYFGEQRFGNGGRNLIQGRKMLGGRQVKDRNKRSIYLSAVRSYLFNQAASHRLKHCGTKPLAGDCVMLAGSRSYFVVEQWDTESLQRLDDNDIQLSAPLWGRGSLLSEGKAQLIEQEALQSFESDCQGLDAAGLQQERRPLLLVPQAVKYQFVEDVLTLEFMLPSGCFATSVLRELCCYRDMSKLPDAASPTASDFHNPTAER